MGRSRGGTEPGQTKVRSRDMVKQLAKRGCMTDDLPPDLGLACMAMGLGALLSRLEMLARVCLVQGEAR